MSARSSIVSEATLLQIAEAIKGVRFGSVQITIHDARVVQIETIQKVRLDPSKAHPIPGGCNHHLSCADQTAGSRRPLESDHDGHVLNGLACSR